MSLLNWIIHLITQCNILNHLRDSKAFSERWSWPICIIPKFGKERLAWLWSNETWWGKDWSRRRRQTSSSTSWLRNKEKTSSVQIFQGNKIWMIYFYTWTFLKSSIVKEALLEHFKKNGEIKCELVLCFVSIVILFRMSYIARMDIMRWLVMQSHWTDRLEIYGIQNVKIWNIWKSCQPYRLYFLSMMRYVICWKFLSRCCSWAIAHLLLIPKDLLVTDVISKIRREGFWSFSLYYLRNRIFNWL